ncbi:MAG: DUF192 domain-containing protein [Myxococcota bacterium]
MAWLVRRIFEELVFIVILPVERCRAWWARARGLLGREAPKSGTALWIVPCRQVHTFGMTYAIDVVALDKQGVVLDVRTLTPWRIGPWIWRAHSTLELAAGEAGRLGITIGVRPTLQEIGSVEVSR